MKTFVISVGAPGAGKQTLIKHGFEGRFDYVHVEMGEVMQLEIDNETELGARISEYKNKGLLVPDEITLQIAEREFARHSQHTVFFSDGFPRTSVQVAPAIALAKKHGFIRFVVIHVNASDDTCIKRMIQRGRKDSYTPELARTRLDQFKEKTRPIIGWLKRHLNDIEADFMTFCGEDMKGNAPRYAKVLECLYDLKMNEAKVIHIKSEQIEPIAKVTAGSAFAQA